MRVVIQRVKKASVTVSEEKVAAIEKGLLILLGIEGSDEASDIEWLCRKIVNLRIFEDQEGAMNDALLDVDGEVIVVSQFTLHASTKKGNRPSFIRAAKPDQAMTLYTQFITHLESILQKKVQTGVFGAMMDVALVNDGPVTILIDSKIRE
ncbi:MAG: D-aminoacyl-tRNA deacylase [Marinirhabdus sp.]|nr:D-aminoacyl-tRNA deacylase [Marinirhabdus sp.]